MSTFTRTTLIRFSHCDPAGIVFFPRLFDLLNDAVEDWFAGPLQHSFKHLHSDLRLGVPTAHLATTFQAPARLGDRLQHEIRVTRVGKTSCGLMHHLMRDETPIAEIDQTLVCADLTTLRPTPWPDALRGALTSFTDD
jgi:4-hydroxybenzoyl-CoA thioesterase